MGRDWANAYKTGDASWYERNLADEAVTVLPSGEVRSKPQSIAALRGRKGTVQSLETSDPDSMLRIQGDMAVETGIERLRARDAQGKPIDQRYRYTVVYIRRDCRWLALVDHATLIQ